MLTGEKREGGRWYKEHHGYMSIPLFARAGSIVAFGAQDSGACYDYADAAEYRVYAPGRGCKAGTCVYGMDHALCAELTVCRTQDGYRIVYKGEKPCTVVIAGGEEPVRIPLERACEISI